MSSLTKKTISQFSKAKVTDNVFDLKTVLEDFIKSTTPGSPQTLNKLTIETQPTLTWPQQLERFRDAILMNLALNPSFKTDYFPYKRFFQMLEFDGADQDRNVIAKHTCALHISKADFQPYAFRIYLNACSDIECIGFDNPILQSIGKSISI